MPRRLLAYHFGMKEKLSNNLLIRVNSALKKDLDAIQADSGLVMSEFVRQCLISMVDYYKKHDSITLPVVVIPKKEYKALTASSKTKAAKS